jgi:ERCC4-type nuclease
VTIGALCSVLARHKVPIIFVGDFLVPITIGVVERFYDGKTPVKLTSYTPIRRKPTSKEIKHAMMEKIPNFGARKVNTLLEKYDIILVNKETKQQPTPEELMEIKGVGNKLAKQLKELL